MKHPSKRSSKPRNQPRAAPRLTASLACYFAGERDYCGGPSVLWRGNVPLCRPCADRASTLTRAPLRNGPTVSTPRSPLEQLQALRRTRESLDTRQAEWVRRARAGGASWADIGMALGITPQGAHKRYAA